MKLLFLVNGSPASAAAGRAAAFAQRLPPEWTVATAYRPARKSVGIAAFLRQAASLRPDIVYVMDTAYSGVLAGVAARRLLGARLILDTGDAAYELAKSSGNYSRAELRAIGYVEQLALRGADAVIVRGSFHKALLEQAGRRSVHFVPDGVDHERVGPMDASALRANLGLTDSLTLGLVGSLSWSARHEMCYGWDITEAIGLLRDPKVKALIVGDGDGRARLEARAEELGVREQIVFTGALPPACLPGYLSAMDACISTQSNDVVGQVRTTGKLPLYLACERYVIASDVGEARRILPGIGCLLPYEGVRDNGHPARLAAHAALLRAQPSLREIRRGARTVGLREFDYRLLAARVQTVCENLASEGKAEG